MTHLDNCSNNSRETDSTSVHAQASQIKLGKTDKEVGRASSVTYFKRTTCVRGERYDLHKDRLTLGSPHFYLLGDYGTRKSSILFIITKPVQYEISRWPETNTR